MSEIQFGMNKNTYNIMFSDYESGLPLEFNQEFLKELRKSLAAFNTIDVFTRYYSKKVLLKLINFYYKIGSKKNYNVDLSKIKYNPDDNEYEYQDSNFFLNFGLLNELIDNKKMNLELTSKKRYGECHFASLFLARNIKDSKVVTGYIRLIDKFILHTVLEVERNGKSLILDWTRNIYTSKEDYLKLTHFHELVSFPGSCVKNDYDILENFDIGIKTYVLFRDEIIHDLEKNAFLFRDEDIKRLVK